jgi:hypothetical protein
MQQQEYSGNQCRRSTTQCDMPQIIFYSETASHAADILKLATR